MKESTGPSSLAAEAYEVVKQRILRGELPMGQVISRRKIAAELGMSFLPVSEAFFRLEFEGLLESRPRAGTRVRIPSREDVRGHYVVREALEVKAAMLFCSGATSEDRDGLVASAVGWMRMSISDEGSVLARSRKIASANRRRGALPGSESCDREDTRSGINLVLHHRPSRIRLPPRRHQSLRKYWSPALRRSRRRRCVSMSLAVWKTRWIASSRISGSERRYGKTFFSSEKRQKQQLTHPSAWN